MANPSSKYVLEDTTISGLVCKRTTQAVKVIYPLYSTLDNSIAYTKPKSGKYSKMTNMLLPSNFPQRAYDRTNYFQNHYYNSSSHTSQSWSTLGQIIGNNNGDTSVLLNWAFASDDTEYMFNGSQGTAVIGNGNQKFITGFDVSHVIFSYSIKGYAKSAFDAWMAGGSSPSVIDITIKNLIDNPDDYYVYRFGVSSSVVWDSDNAQWVSASGSVNPTCLIDGGEDVQGIERPSHVFGYKMGTASGDYSGGINADNYKLYSASENYSISDSTQYIRKGGIPYGLVSNNSYGIGSAPAEWIMKPGWTAEACSQYLETLNAATTDEALNPELFYDNGFVQIYGGDLFSTGKNYSTAVQGEYHYTKWNKRNSFVTKGSVICEFLATIGCYFFTESDISATTLNNDGITPDTLSSIPSIGLGVMYSDGTTAGRWVLGSDIDDYEGINKKGSVIHPDFDPSGGGGGGGSDEDNNDPIPTVGAPFASGLSRYYVTTAASPILAHISEAMGSWDLINSGKDLYKNIISCKLIKSPAPIPVSGSEPFTVYGVTLQYQGSDITLPVVSNNPTASFGSYNIPRKFNDFRDYAPYTRCEIYLPYCGWTALPSHVVGRSVSVTYYTDIIAATCKAVVYCGSNVVAEAAGVIGLDIPMVTENAGAKAEAVAMGLLAYGKAGLQTALGVGAAVATKGKAGVKTAVSGLENVVSAYSQTAMAFNQNYTEINGKNGDGCCIAGISAIVIKITRPKYGSNTTAPYVPAEYPHTVGYVSMKSMKVGSVTGLLVGANVDVSGISGATDREKEIIKRTIENGIIVNAAPSP